MAIEDSGIENLSEQEKFKVGVSVGSGSMQPYNAVLSGVVSGALYLISCVIFKMFSVDDPLENC